MSGNIAALNSFCKETSRWLQPGAIRFLRTLLRRLLSLLGAAGLLGLQVLVEEVKGSLVGLGGTHDGEHALARFVVRTLSIVSITFSHVDGKKFITNLGNRNARARLLADLANLGTGTSNDAANHVSGDADVLRLDLLAILIMGRGAARGGIGIRAAVVGASTTVAAEIGTVASPCDTRATVGPFGLRIAALAVARAADNRVVQNSAGAPLPVVDQALANLPDSALNALGGTLHLDYAFG